MPRLNKQLIPANPMHTRLNESMLGEVVSKEYDTFIDLDGPSSDLITTPDDASYTVTSNFEIVIKFAADAWISPSDQRLVTHWRGAGNQRSFRFNLTPFGELQLAISPNGVNEDEFKSSVAVTATNGVPLWLKVEYNFTTTTAKYFTSSSLSYPDSFTQLGTDITGFTTTSLHNSNAALQIGASFLSTASTADGKVYYAHLSSDDDGILALFRAKVGTDPIYPNSEGKQPWTNDGGRVGPNGLLTGLLNYYKLEEATGSRIDSHGSDDLSTIVSDAGNAAGKKDMGYLIDANTDTIRAESYGPVVGAGDRSMFCWVKPVTSSINNVVFSYGENDTMKRFSLTVQSGFLRIELSGQGHTSALAVTMGVFNHVGLTFCGTLLSDITLWVNGVSEQSIGTLEVDTTVTAADEGLTINGSSQSLDRGFTDATVDEFPVYGKKLLNTDVAVLFNGGAGTFYDDFD